MEMFAPFKGMFTKYKLAFHSNDVVTHVIP
jgi:hypothetical protein